MSIEGYGTLCYFLRDKPSGRTLAFASGFLVSHVFATTPQKYASTSSTTIVKLTPDLYVVTFKPCLRKVY